MRRKIIQQGKGGCTIFLPIQWIRKQGLKPGSEVTIEEQEDALRITGKDELGLRVKSINLPESCTVVQLRSIVASAYKAGYDEIRLHGEKQFPLQTMAKITSSLVGLEMLESDEKLTVLRCFLKPETKEVEPLITKMFQLVKVLAGEVAEHWEGVSLQNIRTIAETVLRLRDHLLRTIHLTRYGGERTYDYYSLIVQLEKVSLQLKYLAEYIVAIQPEKSALLEGFADSFDQFSRAFLSKRFDKARRIWHQHREETKEFFSPDSLPRLFKQEDAGVLLHYYALTRIVRLLSSRILSISVEPL